VIGVDASADGLRDRARRLAAKPARGGLANAMLGVLALAQAPGELAGLADSLTVLLPWGSLLRAVATPEQEALVRLHALCKPGARLRVVFGYGAGDPADVLALPTLDEPRLAALAHAYAAAGLAVRARPMTRDEVGELPTTWARKLAFSGQQRHFVELAGTTQ
jgi:hypothetical protein